jgi:hypothetical protein
MMMGAGRIPRGAPQAPPAQARAAWVAPETIAAPGGRSTLRVRGHQRPEGTMLRPIQAFITDARNGALDEFLRRNPDPVLVVAPFHADEDPRFNTVAGDPSSLVGGVAWVAPVKKRTGSNVFTTMVTIGRARNNDIELNAGTVSKFHAYIMLEPGGPILVDAGSTCGTFVHERRLAARRERHPLVPGDGVRLGSVLLTYYDAATFYEHLRREAERHLRASA